jgi:hypothetical protein
MFQNLNKTPKTMGLFRSSTKKPETQTILIKKKNGIDKKASRSSDDDDVEGDGNVKPKFWRLHEELVGENKPDLVPLPSSTPTKEPPRIKNTSTKKKMFKKLDSVDELSASITPSKSVMIKKKRSSQKKKRTNLPLHALPSLDELSENQGLSDNPQRQRLKTSTSTDSGLVSVEEYQPPPAFAVHTTHRADAHQKKSKKSSTVVAIQGDKKSSRQFQSFMHDRMPGSFSDDTMDGSALQATTSDTQSGLYSESGFPTSRGGHKFQQIVFDNKFNQIEKVKAAKSGMCTPYSN